MDLIGGMIMQKYSKFKTTNTESRIQLTIVTRRPWHIKPEYLLMVVLCIFYNLTEYGYILEQIIFFFF